ncbi:MAG TPA: response regulator, partial [Verrucomicrobiae bacterium]|nr:response regulator [Verrucomicrobiae bacterium]
MSLRPGILLVVDEAAEVQTLTALFHAAAPERPVQTLTTEKEALAALEKDDFEAVFADLRSGALAGTQFLHEVWKVRPKAVRFLLGTSIDSDVMVTCVLGAHHFLPKPLDIPALQAALHRADSMNRLLRNERIQSLVSRMRTLPSRPSLYLELMRELRSSNASATTVGELVAKDLAISARLIQVVNSAYYGLQQQVSDPSAAVLLLGLETTSSLVLSIEAFARFDKVKPLYFSMDQVWKHCQSVAQSAKRIAELLSNDLEVARNAYTAGLLHDIGKLALALNFEEQYHGALKLAEKQKLLPSEVESQVFGANHAEAGAYLLSQWGLPLPIVEAVADHHLPAREVNKVFSAATALHIAERLEYAEHLARNGIKDVPVDFDYPAELELSGRMEELRRIVRREEDSDGSHGAPSESSEGTMIFTRSQLKGSPVPLPANAEPGPMIEAVFDERKGPSKKVIFSVIAVLSIIVGAAITVAFNVQKKKYEQVVSAQNTEPEKDSRGPLSNLLAETSGKIK